jgi:hypothetical protein
MKRQLLALLGTCVACSAAGFLRPQPSACPTPPPPTLEQRLQNKAQEALDQWLGAHRAHVYVTVVEGSGLRTRKQQTYGSTAFVTGKQERLEEHGGKNGYRQSTRVEKVALPGVLTEDRQMLWVDHLSVAVVVDGPAPQQQVSQLVSHVLAMEPERGDRIGVYPR